MKIKTTIILLGLVFSMYSCGTSFGKKKEFGNLEVFYSESVPVKYANAVGQFFIDNQLVLEQPHSIKLTSNHKTFILKLILDSKFTTLPSEKESELKALELAMKNEVFKDVNFEIELCDVNFYPLNLKN